MNSVFADISSDLTKAATVLVAEVFGGLALAILLERLGYTPEWALVPAWLVNVLAARYLAQAARGLGRNALVYGVLSALGPPLAIASFLRLYGASTMSRTDR